MNAVSDLTQTSRRGPSIAARIAALDPEVSYEGIARLLYVYEFSWDIERALEFALFRTYAVPSISGLLAKTGEFETRPRKRYDDTELILAETIENGLDSAQGKRSIARMNAMHGRFKIDNADLLYVLSTFICEPIRWLDRFGRRGMTENERRAWFLYYRGLGERMGIREMPDDLAGMMHLNEAYEAVHFRFADTNHRIGAATVDLLLSFYLPRRLVWIGRPAVRAFLDQPLLDSMGFRPAPGWLRHLLMATLRMRAGVLKLLPRRRKPRRLTQMPRPTYPEGYKIEELGTFPVTKTGP
ncbi:oxygenase MpaB family protein [Bauldia sp.]|uniref:oxygenase MpaB family protein n=1 Tax=Bauldia sp. TaxID=2575872 RepID=UPI003BAB2728